MSSVGPEGEAEWRALERKREIREVVLELLDSPLDLPDRFRGWIPRLVESSGIQVPISQVVGNFVVASTVDGLGAPVHGRTGMVRVGSTPYDFFMLTYDEVYGKWMSSFFLGAVQAVVATTNSTSLTQPDGISLVVVPYSSFLDAGLKPQVRMGTVLTSSHASGVTTAQMAFETYDDADTLGSGTNSSWSLSSTGTGYVFKESGWQDIPSLTTRTFLIAAVKFKSNNASYGAGIVGTAIWLRWVST